MPQRECVCMGEGVETVRKQGGVGGVLSIL